MSLCTAAAGVVSTGLLIAPVSVHRVLFRSNARRVMVAVAHRLARFGIAFLGVAIIGVALLVFDVVRDRAAGVSAAGIVALFLIILWIVMPIGLRREHDLTGD